MVQTYGRDVPLGRIGRPEDIAATVAFLLSTPAIAFVGHVLGPNGGSTRI
jgi:NAD(P)-dependent dehydrogenase (short-subunit alcohol dehydrogenase family)